MGYPIGATLWEQFMLGLNATYCDGLEQGARSTAEVFPNKLQYNIVVQVQYSTLPYSTV